MRKIRTIALVSILALLFAACGGDDTESTETTETTAASVDEGITVGVSWNNYNEERWARWDEPAIKEALDAAGATYISTDAGSSAEQQLADVENLIAQGADALIILAQDGTAILPAVQSALDQGIPVIAYDRLIENPGTLYITFDNIGVGKLMAEVIFEQVPTGYSLSNLAGSVAAGDAVTYLPDGSSRRNLSLLVCPPAG